jgi:hypothetical protein
MGILSKWPLNAGLKSLPVKRLVERILTLLAQYAAITERK